MPIKQKLAIGGIFTLGALYDCSDSQPLSMKNILTDIYLRVCGISIARLRFFLVATVGPDKLYDLTCKYP